MNKEVWDANQIKPPGWHHVQQAFLDGAREARANPEASEGEFWRAADDTQREYLKKLTLLVKKH